MSSGEVPEELLWKGDVDDGSADLGFFGEDGFGEQGLCGDDLVSRKYTEDYDDDDDEEEDDPLEGLRILGIVDESPVQEEEEEEEEVVEDSDEEEDFVTILEASIQRDLPKYVLMCLNAYDVFGFEWL